jgi:hypothetical protein
VKVGALCVVVVAAGGVATLPGLTTAECFLVRVLASMATRGDGIGTIRAIPIILTPTRITAIPTTPALTMATRITVIHITNTVILARSLAWRGYYRGLIDGIFGSETRNPIRSSQAHQGLPITD